MAYRSSHNYLIFCFIGITAVSGCFNAGQPDELQSKASEKYKKKVLFSIQNDYQDFDKFLNQNEKEAVRQIHVKHMANLENWFEEYGALVAQARSDLATFLQTQDREVRKRARDPQRSRKVKAAVALEKQIQKEYEAELIQAIPADKLVLWRQHKIGLAVLECMDSLGLDDAQITKTRKLSSTAAASVSKPRDWHHRGSLILEKLVEDQVLTPAQKKQCERYKTRHRARYFWPWS